ncbi:universal stress protein [Streptomyces albidochromogenes]|uniref:universal stress protein n=1 Tax=Streptomyces albidochromogenes TaxID=329524 RepID=UPI00110FCF05|nr:universal stress protein [Streptomyces albidochromogenes]
MGKAITAGIDGSAESIAAAEWAAREAVLRDLPLTLLHAGYEPLPRSHLPEIDVPAERENLTLDTVGRRLLSVYPGLGLVPRRVPEPPVEALLAAAESSEMLALGSYGFSGIGGFMIGSVALDVTARARGPVVLVRAGERARDEHVGTIAGSALAPYRPVVLGIDLESAGEALLTFAFQTAAARDAPLEILHAWRPGAQSVRDDKQRALSAVLQPWGAKYPDVDVTGQLVEGRAAHRLLMAADRASLVIVGHRDSAGARLGPVTHSAIHHAPCPVAVVPHTR